MLDEAKSKLNNSSDQKDDSRRRQKIILVLFMIAGLSLLSFFILQILTGRLP
jgi:hypothetical protein